MAAFVVRFGLSPEQYRTLTVRERTAIIEEATRGA